MLVVDGKTDYRYINASKMYEVFKMIDKWHIKKDREKHGFSYIGSVNYPTAAPGIIWKEFKPELWRII